MNRDNLDICEFICWFFYCYSDIEAVLFFYSLTGIAIASREDVS